MDVVLPEKVPVFRTALRETAPILPSALTVSAAIALQPLFGLPAWSTRAPFVAAGVLVETVALVAAAWIALVLGSAARFRLGRLAMPATAAMAGALLLAVPAHPLHGAEAEQLAGRLAGLTLLVLGAALPALQGRFALRLGLALPAAASAAGLLFSPAVRPDLVLVTVDTLRADRINGPEYVGLAPNVQRFAGEAVRFTHVWSVAPWTIPATSSIFTGVHPTAHGARFCDDVEEAAPLSRSLFLESPPRAPSPLFTAMSPRLETLPQALSRGGYVTGGFSDWFFISPRTGFGRGFDHFRLAPHDEDHLVVKEAGTWLRDMRRSGLRPVFLYAHLFGPHQPYEAGSDSPADDPGYDGPLPATCFETFTTELNGELVVRRIMEWGDPLPPEDLHHIAALYNAEVRRVDRRFGELLAAVDGAAPSGRETLVVFTADHGDFLGRKNLLDHGHYVYDPVLRVPLLVRYPRSWNVTPRIDPAPVSSVDVYPTLLGAAGVTPSHRLTSQDLPSVAGSAPPTRRLVAENNVNLALCLRFGDRFRHAFDVVVDGRWKLILTDGRTPELFDIEADPGETCDRSADEPRRVADLHRWLETFRQREAVYAPGDGPSLEPEEVRKLRSVGYAR